MNWKHRQKEWAMAQKKTERSQRLGPAIAAQRKMLIEERKRLFGPEWCVSPPFALTPEEMAS